MRCEDAAASLQMRSGGGTAAERQDLPMLATKVTRDTRSHRDRGQIDFVHATERAVRGQRRCHSRWNAGSRHRCRDDSSFPLGTGRTDLELSVRLDEQAPCPLRTEPILGEFARSSSTTRGLAGASGRRASAIADVAHRRPGGLTGRREDTKAPASLRTFAPSCLLVRFPELRRPVPLR